MSGVGNECQEQADVGTSVEVFNEVLSDNHAIGEK